MIHQCITVCQEGTDKTPRSSRVPPAREASVFQGGRRLPRGRSLSRLVKLPSALARCVCAPAPVAACPAPTDKTRTKRSLAGSAMLPSIWRLWVPPGSEQVIKFRPIDARARYGVRPPIGRTLSESSLRCGVLSGIDCSGNRAGSALPSRAAIPWGTG